MIGVGAGAAALIAAIMLNIGAQPDALLYSNLDLREAGSITQALDQAGIKYVVKGDGSTILVERDQVASTRLMLSGKGLPTAGSVGYEIFDNASALGATEFQQNLNRQRALEGELGRTIRSLDGVTSARVHLVMPQRQLFEEEAEKPTASVTIGVGARQPTEEQVRAVQNLIAGAVPNLTPDHVTVIDQHGKTLSAASDGSLAGSAADDRRGEIEERIRRQVMDIVERVVGPGHARVQVNAEVDLSQVTVQEEKFDPDGQVVRSEQTGEEGSRENQTNANGGVTAASNVPGAPPTAGTGDTGNASNSTQSTTNYEISRTTRTEVQAPGSIKRVSVAVAVDGITAPGTNGRPGAYTARSAQDMQRIEALVKASIGFSTDRGDQVTVVNVRFPSDADADGTTAASPLMGFDKNDIMRAVELGVLAIVAILLLFLVVRPLIKGMGQGGGGVPVLAGPGGPQMIVTPGGGMQAQIAVDPQTGQPLALSGPDIENRLDIAKIEGQVKASSVKRVSDFVDKHPEESVSILRSWLHETT
ncbi:MAG: flagellar basal-body MS-ring/collar protein FliF [Caulobacteraceae bacterium]